MGKILKDAAALLVITLVAGILLGAVYTVTLEPIAKQEELAKAEACKEVFSDASEFSAVEFDTEAMDAVLKENGLAKVVVNEVLTAVSADGEKLGYVMTITDGEGYGGDIQFSMGIQLDGTVNGIAILSISETAGLGMKADTEEFRSQFAGKNVEKFEYTKSGASEEHQIDALSGATITTNAMTNGVNGGLCVFQYLEGGN